MKIMIRKTLLAIMCVLCVGTFAFAQEREQLENGMFKVNNAGKYGLQDERGNVIVSAEYDTLSFHKGIAVLIKNGMAYGRVNDAGERVMFEKPYYYNKKYPFYSEGYLVVGRPNFLMKSKVQWFYVDEYGAQIESKLKYFSYAEPFFAGYAVVKIGENYRHIDMAGNLRFKMDSENVIFRSAVYWKGGDDDRCECVIVTDEGIHYCQEDGETAVIKETLYRGSTIEKYDTPDSFGDSSGGILLFNKYGQAMLYDYPDPSDPEQRLVKRFIPILAE
jgi:hypothetical protein